MGGGPLGPNHGHQFCLICMHCRFQLTVILWVARGFASRDGLVLSPLLFWFMLHLICKVFL